MEKENGLGESVSVVVGGEVRVVVVVNGTEWVGVGVEKEKREKGKENGSEGKGESHVGVCEKEKGKQANQRGSNVPPARHSVLLGSLLFIKAKAGFVTSYYYFVAKQQ